MFHSNPLQTLQKLKQKASNEFTNNLHKSINAMLYEKKREKYVMTEIYDLSKELNFKVAEDIEVHIPKSEQQVQAVAEQTDFSS